LEGADSSELPETEPTPVCMLPAEDDAPTPTRHLAWLGWGLATLSIACSLLMAFLSAPPYRSPVPELNIVTVSELRESRQSNDTIETYAGVMRHSDNAQWAAESRTSHTGRLLPTGNYQLL